MKFFSYDSKISQMIIKLSLSCYLNILWFVCSLPVFTIGASTAALYDVTLRMVRDEDPPIARRFFKAFRENFRQATVLWLILLAVGSVLAADGYIVYHMYRSTSGAAAVFWTILLALLIGAAILYVIIMTFIFPLVASLKNTNKAMLKNSLLIGIHYLFCTISVFGIHFAMFFVVVAFFTPMIIFGEGLCALLSSYLLNTVIMACASDPEETPHEAE